METNPNANDLDLSGEYPVGLDDKNRLMIPSDFRKEIAKFRDEPKLTWRIGRGRITQAYPESYYREMIAKRKKSLTPGEKEEAFNRAFHGMTFKLEWDAQGRVVLPEPLISRGRLTKTLMLVGVGDHLELWNRDQWIAESERLLETMDEIIDKDRESVRETTESKS
jgi:MraZ protein